MQSHETLIQNLRKQISNSANKMYFVKKMDSKKWRIYTNWNKNFKLIQTAQNQSKTLKITLHWNKVQISIRSLFLPDKINDST